MQVAEGHLPELWGVGGSERQKLQAGLSKLLEGSRCGFKARFFVFITHEEKEGRSKLWDDEQNERRGGLSCGMLIKMSAWADVM